MWKEGEDAEGHGQRSTEKIGGVYYEVGLGGCIIAQEFLSVNVYSMSQSYT